MNGAEGATGDNGLDDELGGVDLPLRPGGGRLPSARFKVEVVSGNAAIVGGDGGGGVLVLLHGPGPT